MNGECRKSLNLKFKLFQVFREFSEKVSKLIISILFPTCQEKVQQNLLFNDKERSLKGTQFLARNFLRNIFFSGFDKAIFNEK